MSCKVAEIESTTPIGVVDSKSFPHCNLLAILNIAYPIANRAFIILANP